MLGGELIQFGVAEPLGGRRWRLSRLLRGRRGTEAAIGGHAPGEAFVLIAKETLLPIAVPPDQIGGSVMVIASGIADSLGVQESAVVTGRALRPPSPVHLRAEPLEGGGLRFAWTRRSRAGWAWTDGGDVPLGEELERYRLTISSAAGSRTMETMVPAADYDTTLQAEDGVRTSGPLTLMVSQIGSSGVSMPAVATFTAEGKRL